MAFNLDDIIIDRIQFGVAESTDGTQVYYTLTQLSDASIELSAESKDATDAQGTLIKRFWQGKTGTFSATNAMLNLNVLAAQSGSSKTTTSIAGVPRIMTVAKTETSVTLSNYTSDGNIVVYGIGNNGALGTAYTKGTEASATQFAVSGTTLTLPTPTTKPDKWFIKYDRTVEAFHMANKADKFPSTCKLTLKALAVDPCSPDELRACYIVLPSFQPSPEVNFSMTTDATFDYSGDLQVDYCGGEKTLYEIYMVEADRAENDE